MRVREGVFFSVVQAVAVFLHKLESGNPGLVGFFWVAARERQRKKVQNLGSRFRGNDNKTNLKRPSPYSAGNSNRPLMTLRVGVMGMESTTTRRSGQNILATLAPAR